MEVHFLLCARNDSMRKGKFVSHYDCGLFQTNRLRNYRLLLGCTALLQASFLHTKFEIVATYFHNCGVWFSGGRAAVAMWLLRSMS